MTVWINGSLEAEDAPVIRANDRGLTLSDGLFETIRVESGTPLRWRYHMERLEESLAVMGIPALFDRMTLERGVRAVLDTRNLESGVARITVTRGPAARGLALPTKAEPTYLITGGPLPPKGEALRLTLSAIRRNETSPSSRMKTLAYLDNVLALKAARDAGYEDALIRNSQRHLACTSAANIFALRGGRILTPSIGEGCLPGTVRRALLNIGTVAGLKIEETTLFPSDIQSFDGMFITNAVQGPRLIASVAEHGFDPALTEPVVVAARESLGYLD